MMGANIHYDGLSLAAKAKFSQNGDAHVWFPSYELINELIFFLTKVTYNRGLKAERPPLGSVLYKSHQEQKEFYQF